MKYWMFIVFVTCRIMAQQDNITFTYEEYPQALKNPIKGFRDGITPYTSLKRIYINWNDIEDHESDGIDKIQNYWNKVVGSMPASNLKVIPRIRLEKKGGDYWPRDLQGGDYSSEKFKARVRRLIQRLGEVWDNDPRVAYVQIGSIYRIDGKLIRNPVWMKDRPGHIFKRIIIDQ